MLGLRMCWLNQLLVFGAGQKCIIAIVVMYGIILFGGFSRLQLCPTVLRPTERSPSAALLSPCAHFSWQSATCTPLRSEMIRQELGVGTVVIDIHFLDIYVLSLLLG